MRGRVLVPALRVGGLSLLLMQTRCHLPEPTSDPLVEAVIHVQKTPDSTSEFFVETNTINDAYCHRTLRKTGQVIREVIGDNEFEADIRYGPSGSVQEIVQTRGEAKNRKQVFEYAMALKQVLK